MKPWRFIGPFAVLAVLFTGLFCPPAGANLDLTGAALVTPFEDVPSSERMAADLLLDEIERRTGIRPPRSNRIGDGRAEIVLSGDAAALIDHPALPGALRDGRLSNLGGEGYCLYTETSGPAPRVWILSSSPRGALFGAGGLLRKLVMAGGAISLREPLDIVTAPAYPIRGHQLGYRDKANSYDAWTPEAYEQYIRDLIVFGANAVENIPLPIQDPGPHMPLPRMEMNVRISEICQRYDLQHWMWIPASYDLTDGDKKARALAEQEELYRVCPRIDAVFVPGGDPGRNHPQLLLPFMEEAARILNRYHPAAKMWVSLQGFEDDWVEYAYTYIEERRPDWLGGVVAGPSSPPIKETRARLPEEYGLRHYPDITHTVRCQYPVPWWDPAFNFTLGREPINPQPVYYSYIHNAFAPYTTGSISYSDGAHDDVNKAVWSRLGWDPETDVREIVEDYARYFFGDKVAQRAADGIFALEKNWEGTLITNGAVEGTLLLWRSLDEAAPALRDNWRWRMLLLRAEYDAYQRRRLAFETGLETKANAVLLRADAMGADKAIAEASALLSLAETANAAPGLRRSIEEHCEALFEQIGLQTSVEKHQADGPERGCILDFVDHPLNNRWWLEDRFAEISAMENEADKVERLAELANWENPGPGGFYDDIGNVAKSPRVIRGEGINTDPLMMRNPNPDWMWWDQGRSRERLSFIGKMDWPIGLRYTGLGADGDYVLRLTGMGDAFPRVDGERVEPSRYSKETGGIKEFPVPGEALRDRELVVTFDVPSEPGINWRYQSRLNEAWLIRVDAAEGKRR